MLDSSRTSTGWKPTIAMEDGLQRTVEWFRANGHRWSWEAWMAGTHTIA